MFMLKKQHFMIKGIVVYLLIMLISTSVFSQINKGAELTVDTDQPQYYPGEEVHVFGWLKDNGIGVPFVGICIEILDPNDSSIFGVCILTNDTGYYEVFKQLNQGALLGNYNVSADSYDYGIIVYNEFEVVSPIVEAEANGPYEGTVNVPIDFYGNATGGKLPYSWHWDFGDNTTADTQNATHNYTEPGQYTATLTATDNDSHQGNDTAFVTVSASDNQPPYPLGLPSGPSEGDVGIEYTFCIEFTDPEEDNIYVMWDWGDGTFSGWLGPFNSGEEVCASHVWTAGGDYELRVKAKDEHGAESNWSDPLLFHVKAPILEVEISGGLGLTLVIRNVGDGDAHNVTWYFSTQGGILGLINMEEEGLISTLPAGGEESIVLTKLLFGLGSIEITIEISADYVNTETATISAFIIGPFIIIV